jgi:hypothetical protein
MRQHTGMSRKWNGKSLARLMRRRHLSALALSRALRARGDFAGGRAAVEFWVKGTEPRGQSVMALAQLFGVSPTYFYGKRSRRPVALAT